MTREEKIKSRHAEALLLRKSLTKGFVLWKKRKRNKLSKAIGERDDLLHELLTENNTHYQDLIAEQMEILAGSVLQFKCYKSLHSITSAYAYRFTGNIRDNGHVYLDVSETSWAAGLLYSNKFEGAMDSFGNVEMISSKLGGSMMKNFPSAYEGQILENGFFSVEAVQTEWDIVIDRFVQRMVAKVFTEKRKTNMYFANRQRLVELTNDELEKLLTTTGHTL